jgi:uncharacterized protein
VTLEALALLPAATVGSAAQSATGYGLALPVAPVAVALLAPADAVLAVTCGGIMHASLAIATRRRRLDVRKTDAALVLAAAVPGLLLGALLVSRVPTPPLQIAVGLAILLAAGLRLHEPGRAAGLATPQAGLLAGALTTTVGICGPPLVIWLRARRVGLTQLRDTLAIVFLGLNLAAVPSVAAGGASVPLALLALLAAGLVAGHVAGVAARRRLEAGTLERSLAAILVAAGAASVIGGVATLGA